MKQPSPATLRRSFSGSSESTASPASFFQVPWLYHRRKCLWDIVPCIVSVACCFGGLSLPLAVSGRERFSCCCPGSVSELWSTPDGHLLCESRNASHWDNGTTGISLPCQAVPPCCMLSVLMGGVCMLQEAQRFTDLLGDHGKPVWPLWELMKWLVGMSSHTLPAIGNAGRGPGMCRGSGGVGKLLDVGVTLPMPSEGTWGLP